MRFVNNSLLRLLLFTFGHGLALMSRFIPSVRSQITRTLTFEISTDDGAARHWYFDGQQRRIATRTGRAHSPLRVYVFGVAGGR
jgi:hypothetical protein